MTSRISVGIVNVTGYTGVELARLLLHHPEARLTSVTGRSSAGQKLSDVYPHLGGRDLVIEPELGPVDIAFLALPHGSSLELAAKLLGQGIKVIDLSADFRLKDVAEYEKWYGVKHDYPQYLREACYGLPELHRREITAARLVANPGCYSTSAILALGPLVAKGITAGNIVIDSKSGLSGAGRSLSLLSHFAEANEDVCAYSLGGHRHLPEIAQELEALGPQSKLRISFVPHLVPMTRGILSTCYVEPASGVNLSSETLLELYCHFYQGEPFVRIVDSPPHTKHTLGSNLCLIYPALDPATGRVIVISSLDNLVKGAAGQAVQNMNLMAGIDESSGLDAIPIYP